MSYNRWEAWGLVVVSLVSLVGIVVLLVRDKIRHHAEGRPFW